MSPLRSLALAAAATLALTAASHRPATVFDLSDDVGRAAPALALSVDGGTTVDLTALRGEPTYVFLFSGWCAPCQQELPFVRSAYANYGDRVHFVGVDVLEDAAAAKAAVTAAALPFPVAVYSIEQLDAVVPPDVQLRSGMKYKIPADFLIDADGVVRFAWHGLSITNDREPVDVLPSYLAKLGLVAR
ncbi:MAG TPA: TlpA disulfide reductase family protein [Candidatus Elarobacter sp.]|jgi:thiol-disulfide isomerase/thioredoxin|nr:TlpA disulfide reductase family protein [Candidatus Elarobacter sp.]